MKIQVNVDDVIWRKARVVGLGLGKTMGQMVNEALSRYLSGDMEVARVVAKAEPVKVQAQGQVKVESVKPGLQGKAREGTTMGSLARGYLKG